MVHTKKFSKQTSRWLPQTEQQTKRIEVHQPWPFEVVQVNICFLGGPLRLLTEQKKQKFLRKIKTILGERPSPFYSSESSKFPYCWLWFRPTPTLIKTFFQLNLHKRNDSLFIYFRKLVCSLFWIAWLWVQNYELQMASHTFLTKTPLGIFEIDTNVCQN